MYVEKHMEEFMIHYSKVNILESSQPKKLRRVTSLASRLAKGDANETKKKFLKDQMYSLINKRIGHLIKKKRSN
jgi:hypothetical protein